MKTHNLGKKGATIIQGVLVMIMVTAFILLSFSKTGADILKRSDQSGPTFTEFNFRLNELYKDTSKNRDSMELYIKKEGGVVVYNSGVESFGVKYSIDNDADVEYFVGRSPNCDAPDYVCICYFTDLEYDGGVYHPKKESSNCKTFEGELYLNFRECDSVMEHDCFKNIQYEVYQKPDGSYDNRELDKAPLGFILSRRGELRTRDSPDSRTIYMEKYKEYISVGLKWPVFTDSDKKLIDFEHFAGRFENCTVNEFCELTPSFITDYLPSLRCEEPDNRIHIEKKGGAFEITAEFGGATERLPLDVGEFKIIDWDVIADMPGEKEDSYDNFYIKGTYGKPVLIKERALLDDPEMELVKIVPDTTGNPPYPLIIYKKELHKPDCSRTPVIPSGEI
ncbi:MAG: hypothetical protein KKG59_01735 [Nanoarchaeota archaeon]|nr:hypothetical protein [Nanoarchaeota archaeon]